MTTHVCAHCFKELYTTIPHTCSAAPIPAPPKQSADVFSYEDFRDPNYAWPPSPEDCAEIANRVLAERSTVVYGGADGQWSASRRDERNHAMISSNFINDTCTGLLINVRPIENPDTAEQFVKDMAGHAKFQYGDGKWAMNAEYWVERAKKLLGK